MTSDAPAPPWAGARGPDEVRTVAGPCGPIPCRVWTDPGEDVVVLVHGITAHQRWWDRIAPAIARGRTVVTMDLAGHGDGVHVPRYTFATWAQEVRAVASAVRRANAPSLVGHSMGGTVCLLASQVAPDEVARVIAIDSVIRDAPTEESTARRTRARAGRHRVYATRDEAIARFQTIPPSSRIDDGLLREVARDSVHEVPDGWSWKFDLRVMALDVTETAHVRRTDVPVVLIRADNGLVDDAMADLILDRLGPSASVRVIPDCGHHVLLERPAELVAELERALATG